MITYFIQSSACLFVLYGIYHFVLAELTFFRYNRIYLLSAILVSLLIPILAPLWYIPNDIAPAFQWNYAANDVIAIVENKSIPFDYFGLVLAILKTIYLIGVSVVLAKMFHGIFKIVQYYHNGQLSIGKRYTIVSTEAVHLPFSFFHFIFLSKHIKLENHIQTILEHEEIHIKHWHTVDVLFTEIVHAFFWFNPVMIYYKRALRQAHEFLADDVICSNNSVSSYTDLLLSKSQSGLELALTNQFFHSQIKKRIQMMTTNKTSKFQSWKYALVLPVIAILMFLFSCKETSTVDPVSIESTTQNNENAVESSNEPYSEAEMKDIFRVVEEMPRFPGCEQIATMDEKEECAKKKMLEYIYKNLKYPKVAREGGLEGQCVAQFIISKDGSIKNIKIVRDIGGDCGEAVRNVISSMNDMPEKWISGKQSGKPVSVMFTLPVKFKLEDDGKSIGMTKKKSEKFINKTSELATNADSLIEDALLKQRIKEDEGYYADQKDISLDILDALFNPKVLNKPLFLIDGVVIDPLLLVNRHFNPRTVMVMPSKNAIEMYGEKAKYGAVEFIEPRATTK